MIALFTLAVALLGLADAHSCTTVSCFAKVDQYKTLQDFVPRKEEITQYSFCKDVNEALTCINEAQQNKECPLLISRGVQLGIMRTLCQGQLHAPGSNVGLERSPCTKGIKSQNDKINRECWQEFRTYAPTEPRCAVSEKGRLCMMRVLEGVCGPSWTTFFSGMWDALGLNGCIMLQDIYDVDVGIKFGNLNPTFNLLSAGYGVPEEAH